MRGVRRALHGAHAAAAATPAAALAALGWLLDAAGALAEGGGAAWPSAAPLVRDLALQAGERYLGAVGGVPIDSPCKYNQRLVHNTGNYLNASRLEELMCFLLVHDCMLRAGCKQGKVC